MLLVDGYVRHHIRQSLELWFISETGRSQDGADDHPPNLAQLVDPVRLPRIVAAAQEAMMDDDEDLFETELDFGLRIILDVIEALARR